MAQAALPHGTWTPDWAVHPGAHLAEYLEAREWTQKEFADIAGLTPKLVSTIINGQNPITPDTAIKLERVFGLPAYVWTGLQSRWDLWKAREDRKIASGELKAWLANFPIKELKSRWGLLGKKDDIGLADRLMGLLGVGGPGGVDAKINSLAVQHRQSKSHKTSHYHVLTWLMLGEQKARAMDLAAYDPDKFRKAVGDIRTMTVQPREYFEPRMIELCRASGVALVFERPISKTCLYGSARWLDSDHAIIQMSLRMKSNDHFWWTFFHEAAHILLHRGSNFADDDGGMGDVREDEADHWAEDMLVGRERFADFKSKSPNSAKTVKDFAGEIGIHPGIVVGMLQHAGLLPHHYLNGLKERFDWGDAPVSDDAGASPLP